MRAEEFPLRGVRVIVDTRVVVSSAAVLRGRIVRTLGLVFFAGSVVVWLLLWRFWASMDVGLAFGIWSETMRVRTEADFDALSWHDCHIWGMDLRPGDPDRGDWRSDFVLHLDFIAEWLCGVDGQAQFRVAPATLIFHGVTDLRINIDWLPDITSRGLHRAHRTGAGARSEGASRSAILCVDNSAQLAAKRRALLRSRRVHPDPARRAGAPRPAMALPG